MVGGRYDDRGGHARNDQYEDQFTAEQYELRPGHHYGQQAAQDGEQEYDPRAYAPNPEEPYGYDDDGRPIYYEPEPAALKSGRNGLVMIGAVVAVALFGGAGAVAYKMMAPGGLSGEPPLIKAETEPFKTLPKEGAQGGQMQNKAVYDRIDTAAAPKSKVLSREEEPVDLPSAPSGEPRSTDASRVILPGGPASAQPTPPDTHGADARRVKTVSIKPNAPIAPVGSPPRTEEKVAAARPADPIGDMARSGNAPRSDFDNGIMADGGPQLASTPAARATPQTVKPTTTPDARKVATQPIQPARSATPAPTAPATPAQRPADPTQVAAVSPRAATPAPAPAASSGGFVVQVTSQRSEADARTAYAALQRKFPQVLGPYKASVQTATVADRGTYYRVRVGPFSSSSDASTVCNNLRSAGGDCVVSRN